MVTAEDLRDLVHAPGGTSLVLEEGRARIVPQADAGPGVLMTRSDLLALLGGEGAAVNDETLDLVAAGLDDAVRQQSG